MTEVKAATDAVLDAMQRDGRLAVPVKALVEAIGDGADAAIGELLDGEKIEAWEHPRRGLCLVFKSWTAEARGLMIDPDGTRWVSRGRKRGSYPDRVAPKKWEVTATDAFGDEAARAFANLADRKAIEPLEAMAAGEAMELKLARRKGPSGPRIEVIPWIILGIGVP